MYDIPKALAARSSGLKNSVSPDEWEARVELAACYRLCAHFRMTDLIFNHISLRVPGTEDQFLINGFGLLYEEVTASNLVKVDIDGNILDDGVFEVNRAGFVIHSALHKARHDIACIVHTHTRAGVAVSASADGLLNLSQQALHFYNRISYHKFEGIALDLEEQQRLVADLGSTNAMILRNHGLLTAGATVGEAFDAMYFLEAACQIQLDILATAPRMEVPSDDVCERTARQYETAGGLVKGRTWAALCRMMDRKDPSYRN